ncbi:MAG: hypothetical protein COZ46_04655 [Verrucomicrobia bacterium CG_4_10_14_3_um_filter_43_23]|nr:MAG: hypothetical protein AUJ82_07265 [Verrucomicrobia bacterium CG1_02_43_26]PIP58560.1 MAG: hypothetical protein COX01_07980 [Verrucomicrobia bacterium CG22_combo_CG10-13_8_21_14_all_43_17]PIX58277.1 MAG: hypothetical protein COZ46_04655 [Verrucomicrobia bacterium CG_4_10_14_3_um_filter_43_23]PIY60787.1 MAG: hypothetical protein COY94_08570 [Verrucomicrobia bacterium CG_4_10_14_0_8_um_filter_43_34]PJA43540.1 MAG: hypothetical protein CO175_07525 [Verrucomicrobia bacterium CG_4_9_14_3_um_fi
MNTSISDLIKKTITPAFAACALFISPSFAENEVVFDKIYGGEIDNVEEFDQFVDKEMPLSAQESLLENLIAVGPDNAEKYQETIKQARESGMSAQEVLETEIYYHLIVGGKSGYKEILEQLNDLGPKWDFTQESLLFREPSDIPAMRYLLKARIAFLNNDEKAFEKNAKNAFWAEPDHAHLLGEWIQEYRFKKAMNRAMIPMDVELSDSQGNATTLGQLLKGQKAILIDFWASWCSPCMALMPSLSHKAEILAPQGVIVVGMNTETVQKAEVVRKKLDMRMPWLVEPADHVYSKLFKVNSIPRMVLIDKNEEILFNGHPMDDKLNAALQELGVRL